MKLQNSKSIISQQYIIILKNFIIALSITIAAVVAIFTLGWAYIVTVIKPEGMEVLPAFTLIAGSFLTALVVGVIAFTVAIYKSVRTIRKRNLAVGQHPISIAIRIIITLILFLATIYIATFCFRLYSSL